MLPLGASGRFAPAASLPIPTAGILQDLHQQDEPTRNLPQPRLGELHQLPGPPDTHPGARPLGEAYPRRGECQDDAPPFPWILVPGDEPSPHQPVHDGQTNLGTTSRGNARMFSGKMALRARTVTIGTPAGRARKPYYCSDSFGTRPAFSIPTYRTASRVQKAGPSVCLGPAAIWPSRDCRWPMRTWQDARWPPRCRPPLRCLLKDRYFSACRRAMAFPQAACVRPPWPFPECMDSAVLCFFRLRRPSSCAVSSARIRSRRLFSPIDQVAVASSRRSVYWRMA